MHILFFFSFHWLFSITTLLCFHQQITDKITTCSSELRPLFNFIMFSSIDKITTWSSELRLFSTLLCFHQQITDKIAICLSELRPFFYFVMFSSTDHKLYQFHHIMHQQITCDTHLSVFHKRLVNFYIVDTKSFVVNIIEMYMCYMHVDNLKCTMSSESYVLVYFFKYRFKRWSPTIRLLSTKQTIGSHRNSLNTQKKTQYIMLEIQILDCNRHKNVISTLPS